MASRTLLRGIGFRRQLAVGSFNRSCRAAASDACRSAAAYPAAALTHCYCPIPTVLVRRLTRTAHWTALEFAPDITIVSAGFDAARGDPLGCCDVTPAGYAQMTHMLCGLSQGKLLVILEGGYNLRSISSSATAVVKVLLGENPSSEMGNDVPSKDGLQTILQVLKVQLKYWPILKSNYMALQSQWGLVASDSRDQMMKRPHEFGPVWWKWGSKRFVYELFYGRPHSRRRVRIKRLG